VLNEKRSPIVDRVVQMLPPGEREVLELVAFEGLSYAEIADRLEIPVGTVASRLSSARQKIHHALAAEEHRTGGGVR
jgi:RNA polymerase sigma-70 factor (ECF subfamily)